MKKVLRWIADAFLSIGRGDILIKLGVHRYLPHIVVAFLFCTLSIILSYLADNTLSRRSSKMKELEDAKIIYNIKNGEMISRSTSPFPVTAAVCWSCFTSCGMTAPFAAIPMYSTLILH